MNQDQEYQYQIIKKYVSRSRDNVDSGNNKYKVVQVMSDKCKIVQVMSVSCNPKVIINRP